tara:strand:- start:251 stop:523 length:273 start_codon:yes stop_codon:yes gene_type:complete
MSEKIAIAMNADGLFDLVPTTGLHSLDSSQKIDSLMEVKTLDVAERYLELWNNTNTKRGVAFLLKLHQHEHPYNSRLEGPLLTKFIKTYG